MSLRKLYIALALAVVMAVAPIGAALMLNGWEPPRPVAEGAPVRLAVVNIWVYLGMMVLSWIITAALTPKPRPPEIQRGTVPTVTDGKRVIRIYGTQWIEDPGVLAMQQVDPADPIRTKGGKK